MYFVIKKIVIVEFSYKRTKKIVNLPLLYFVSHSRILWILECEHA